MKLIVTYKTFISCLGFFKFVSYFRYGAREVSAGAEGESVKEKLNNLRQLEIGQKVKKFLHLSERFPFFSRARMIGRIV